MQCPRVDGHVHSVVFADAEPPRVYAMVVSHALQGVVWSGNSAVCPELLVVRKGLLRQVAAIGPKHVVIGATEGCQNRPVSDTAAVRARVLS